MIERSEVQTIDGETFPEQIFAPVLRPGDLVVMDDLSSLEVRAASTTRKFVERWSSNPCSAGRRHRSPRS